MPKLLKLPLLALMLLASGCQPLMKGEAETTEAQRTQREGNTSQKLGVTHIPLELKAIVMRKITLLLFLGLLFSSSLHAQGFYRGNVSELQAEAAEKDVPYVIELNATWCGFCKKFERETLTDSTVISYLEQNYFMATTDGEEGFGLQLAEEHNIRAFPALLFFADNGELINKKTGYQDPQYFLYNLKKYRKKFDRKYR